jgi:hypothetical protein
MVVSWLAEESESIHALFFSQLISGFLFNKPPWSSRLDSPAKLREVSPYGGERTVTLVRFAWNNQRVLQADIKSFSTNELIHTEKGSCLLERSSFVYVIFQNRHAVKLQKNSMAPPFTLKLSSPQLTLQSPAFQHNASTTPPHFQKA